MEIEKLPTYEQVIKYLDGEKRSRHLLIGNGFSMAYDHKIFSYNALSNFVERTDNALLKKLFETVNTKNFEQIMQQLETFCEIAPIFSDDIRLVEKLKNANLALKTSLIDAVKELHPEHVFSVPEESSKRCFEFIEDFISKKGKVYSTNYDLLLYWVLMRNKSKYAIDGFGREVEYQDEYVAEEELEYSDLRWGKYKEDQTIFYMHGTLPLFDTGIDIVKEEYDNEHYLLEKVAERMHQKDYPIFVTAGNAKEKLNHIMHNKYLSFCYENFSELKGSLITFGFNFGDYDTHIIDAINKAAHFGKKSGDKLFSVYIGVYSDEDLKHINKIKSKFKVKVTAYNARSAQIWR